MSEQETRQVLRALERQATKAPWFQHHDDPAMVWHGDEAETYRLDEAARRSAGEDVSDEEWERWGETTGPIAHGDLCEEADAAFIAAARNALLSLLDDLDAAEAERDNALALARSMDHFADVAELVERRNNELVAQRDSLRVRVAALEARVAGALAETRRVSPDRNRVDVSCGGWSVNDDGCYAADVAARVRTALSATQPETKARE